MSEIKEKWKTIRGLPKYEVSSLGSIRIKNTNKHITQFVRFGRNVVALSNKNGTYNHYYVDNLVTYNFLPIPYSISEPKVYHKNKNYLDDRLENLHFMKNAQTNCVLVNIYLFKNNKCYLVSTMSYRKAKLYLNCKDGVLLHALAHTSIIKNDGKEYKVEYSFNKI